MAACSYLYVDLKKLKNYQDNKQELLYHLIRMNIVGGVLFIFLAIYSFIEIISIIGIFAKYWYISAPILLVAVLLCPGLWRYTTKGNKKHIINLTNDGVINAYLVAILFLLVFYRLSFVFGW